MTDSQSGRFCSPVLGLTIFGTLLAQRAGIRYSDRQDEARLSGPIGGIAFKLSVTLDNLAQCRVCLSFLHAGIQFQLSEQIQVNTTILPPALFSSTAMRLNNLVKVEGLADLNLQCTRADLLDQFVERCAHEVFGFTRIGRQTDRRRNRFHWGGPMITVCHANAGGSRMDP
jgi:hypothetical protein